MHLIPSEKRGVKRGIIPAFGGQAVEGIDTTTAGREKVSTYDNLAIELNRHRTRRVTKTLRDKIRIDESFHALLRVCDHGCAEERQHSQPNERTSSVEHEPTV